MWLLNVCLIHLTTNSVSDSVNSMGRDDLNKGPRFRAASSDTDANCSEKAENPVYSQIFSHKNGGI